MWGDAEGALRLQASDNLAAILFQITGPAHIPHQDPRWQEFIHGYDIWVHVEPRDVNGVIDHACQNIAPNAPQSSNLAAYTMHVTRMIRELTTTSNRSNAIHNEQRHDTSAVNEFSNRIATVGRARAASGNLNLLRILIHSVITYSRSPQLLEQQSEQFEDPDSYLAEAFLYKSRDSVRETDTGADLIDALMKFFVSEPSLSSTVPELYDATVLALQLLLVLLSTQLYQPMVSSFQRLEFESEQQQRDSDIEDDLSEQTCGFFWDTLMQQAHARYNKQQQQQSTTTAFPPPSPSSSPSWAPRTLLLALLEWTHRRPKAPDRSIAYHNNELAQSVVKAKGERMGADGMYESYIVVMASAPLNDLNNSGLNENGSSSNVVSEFASNTSKAVRRNSNLLIDATKGVLTLGSSIILLPFRLMKLALGLWGNKERGYDMAHRNKMLQTINSLTKDVLWLSESPVADLSGCFLLLLLNNERANNNSNNPFRDEITSLTDNRWESDGHGLPDLPDLPLNMNGGGGGGNNGEFTPLMALSAPQPQPPLEMTSSQSQHQDVLAFNFETLFGMFGLTSHTEVGALLLYTLMQSSRAFAESLAVRSDLDTLVLPLLRTLYVSSSVQHYAAQDFVSRAAAGGRDSDRRPSDASGTSSTDAKAGSAGIISIRNCPFRSQSQLYVIIILLLLFSQDASFGPDAFRRNLISNVPWYKERLIKDANLGSVLLLCLLRSLTFNLNRLHDPFLLSNCCAILMNLSPAISDLHEYAAIRLAAITVSSMRRYAALREENPDTDEEDLSTPTAMHGEVSRTLLRVLKQCLNAKNIERNLNLVYALVYHQADFNRITSQKGSPFKKGQTDRVLKVIAAASSVIEKEADARTAAKALKVLSENIDQIRDVISDRRKRSDGDGFTFTYEEESDPEVFFVPYVWEVIVCAATAGSIEWNKSRILVFPLLDDPSKIEDTTTMPIDVSLDNSANVIQEYSRDVSDVV